MNRLEAVTTGARPSVWPRMVLQIGLGLALFLVVCHRVLQTPFWSFNGSRLIPSFAVIHGLNYYVLSPSDGPLYDSFYGPLVSLIYLPATLLPGPNSAVLAGSVITVLLCFSATALVHFTTGRPYRRPYDGIAFLTAGFLICFLEPLKYSCFNIHADGPGLAFGAVACALLFPGAVTRRRAALPLSALFAVLAIFCKQTFLPVPIALLFYVWLAEGGPRARSYFIWIALAVTLTGGIVIAIVGPARLYHCLVWIPAHHPWNDRSRIVSAIQALRSFIRVSMPVPVLLLASLVYYWSGRNGRLREPVLRAFAANRCAPLLLTGLALLPFSIAGRAKTGGDINSLSFALFFLTCGLTVLLADVAENAPAISASRLAIAGLAATLLPAAISETPLAVDIPASMKRLPQAPQEVAYRYLRRHPGEAYFPWLPLSHYYAEHRFYDYASGIVDRLLAGELLSEAAVRAYMPNSPKVIAFAADGTPQAFGYDLLKYLPGYRRQIADPELPGWMVYARSLSRAAALK